VGYNDVVAQEADRSRDDYRIHPTLPSYVTISLMFLSLVLFQIFSIICREPRIALAFDFVTPIPTTKVKFQ